MHTTQVEVTTECNLKCWYCVGRSMEQKHMPLSRFIGLVSTQPIGMLWLQGEGEPSLWPHMEMAVRWAKEKGFKLYVITNGTTLLQHDYFKEFEGVGISVDSVDEKTSASHGRPMIGEVIRSITEFKKTYKGRIAIHTVDNGQDLQALRTWCARNGFQHVVQKLQTKVDYARVYQRKNSTRNVTVPAKATCRIFTDGKWTYFDVNGLKLPCCYIKDISRYNYEAMTLSFEAQLAPQECHGCRFLIPAQNVQLLLTE
jgi:MoaA/NifB/PqqE/SkfB family radical SAM enzyme